MTPNIGIVYQVQPEPPGPECCREFPAGAVTFVLEYRQVDPERLARSYAGDAAALAEIEAHSPEGGFTDCGVSVHVLGSANGHEYLRFDVFDQEPHYHYVRPSGDYNHWVPFDPIAGGDMLPFAMTCLRERLASMLHEAGGDDVAGQIRENDIVPVVDELERIAIEVRDQQRTTQAAATPS